MKVKACFRLRDERLGDFGRAWIYLTLALGLHVADEALNGFLAFYNPIAAAIRARLPFLPIPVFDFRTWLAGLILAVGLLFSLSFFAYKGSKWIIALAYIYGGLMISNGLSHMISSIYCRRLIPGVISSGILIFCSGLLLVRGHRLATLLLDTSDQPGEIGG